METSYAVNSFDIVIAIEVSEHILDHETIFKEINRILKPEGKLYLTTPNVLSKKIKSTLSFHGFYYHFNRLERGTYDGLQHVASIILNHYNYIATNIILIRQNIALINSNVHQAAYS
jgi:2-polyprenyl-3-methyl-5-hydroxy-6-metoxy-1,4-benzoquinol methylase